jgi:hypothetical protein
LIPILTHKERLARDEDYSEDGEELPMTNIEVSHLKAEVAELRAQLENRVIVSPVLEHDLNLIKGLKRDFVDRLIGAGVQYNLCGNVSALLNVMLNDLQDNIPK